MAEPHSDIPPEDDSDDEQGAQSSSSKTCSDVSKNYRSMKPVCNLNGKDYWVVEAIRDVQVDDKGSMLYLVKWQDWPESDNSWEPEENCNYSRRLISEFHQSLSESKRNTLAQRILLQSMARTTATPSSARVTPASTVRKPAAERKPYSRKSATTTVKTAEKPVKNGKKLKKASSGDEGGSEGYHSTPSTPTSSLQD
ncbi:hypothetical protein RvY_11625 [Ramazzottius varieornatus]|uniref:Chromo domain-containing protein n=1 Tax=Ramazzottius varieornatus TaxID=947166 RepID=A0A1D1VIT0_RAMVA|nr:hypothetical protein RvY_11625 [Ramazzottius varieornatus]